MVIETRSFFFKTGLDFSGRPYFYTTNMIAMGKGITFNLDPKAATFMRKVVTPHIKMHGQGLQQMENIVAAEIKDLIQRIQEQNGKPFDPQYQLGKFTVNFS